MAMTSEINQFVCEYRTLFEDVANTVPNIRPADDVMYSTMDYGKILSKMTEFLEGYVEYRDGNNSKYDDRIITSTKGFYDSMFADMSVNSPYRHSVTLEDMRTTGNETFLRETHRLQTVMEAMLAKYPDFQTKQLATMTQNQYNKLARVYRDDASLYLWLATGNSKTHPKDTSVENRINFMDIGTPVVHRLDQYAK